MLLLKSHSVALEPRAPAGTRIGGQWTKIKMGDAHPSGHAPSTEADRQVIKERGHAPIPPMSWGLWVNPDPHAELQAKWYDRRGREQRRYSAGHFERTAEVKFEKVYEFAKALPKIRLQVERDLRRKGLSKEKVAAAVVSIIDQTVMRVGSEEFAEENETYGASSLRKTQVKAVGQKLSFHFPGKHSQEWQRELVNGPVAAVVRRLKEYPGDRLFQYQGPGGKLVPCDESKVNAYLKPFGVTAKQFRTYHASKLAAERLKEIGPPANEKDAAKKIAGVCKEVAAMLGNTPAVARSSYINPKVLNAYAVSALDQTGGQLEMFKALSSGEEWFSRFLDRLAASDLKDEDPFPEDIEKSLKDPSYDPEHPEECCPHCGARLERGDDGRCNRCRRDWPEVEKAVRYPGLVLRLHRKPEVLP